MTQKELNDKKKVFKNAYKDAKKSITKGNMFMLAIAVLIGAAFGAVVSSLANDVIMAAIAKIWNASSVEDLKVAGTIKIGKFLAALIQFVIVATVVFFTLLIVFSIKNAIEYAKAKKMPIEPEAEPTPTNEELILAELKKLNSQIENLNRNQN
ncbi:large conductance mechanosensitive channel protein [Metamycoplasma arthritidis]|uniref:Large-conductance mechanosensitive channel, putative n=1 Tax=Metamycoplasma arthritidis (strain 158L3-1) TaxID=243272 RepID=B3PMZ4_META1|nr:MscL family protein [Metamycoplasma arthritidis]ACF07396.1 large-conductance mechanosensitive channel, putative [Metamycoplasma arthritidis 158L3-1]VEU78918.1 large conductance mechanosensitive channel protein [Metamycoplasma arthritidis]